jgi:putative phosphoesterase
MRLAIFSDIHGNMPALEAVLAEIQRQSFDAVYCLGDLVGYGASPNEVTERMRREGIATVIGNYDDGVGYDRDDCGCAYREEDERQRGQQSLEWTRSHTTSENKAFLRSLHREIRFDAGSTRVLLVHASPRKLNEYLFEDRPLASFERLAASSGADIIVFGHTHKPYTKLVGEVLFVNVGSVGKPKDGDWRACYATIDSRDRKAAFVRVAYDIDRATAAIRATDLPGQFADDLQTAGARQGG